MKRFRFSITGLMALILLVALGAVALRGGTALWASATFAATLALLSTGALCAIFRRGRTQVGWAGFALFGWPYLIAAFGPGAPTNGVTVPPLPPLLLHEPLKNALAPPGSITIDDKEYNRTVYIDPGPNPEIFSQFASVYFLPPDKVPGDWTVVATSPATGQGRIPPGRNNGAATFRKSRSINSMPGMGSGAEMMQGMMMGMGGPGGMGPDGLMPPGSPPPPGMVSAHPPEISGLQVRRVLHCLGAIALGLIGAGIGLVFVAPPVSGRRPDDPPEDRGPADPIHRG